MEVLYVAIYATPDHLVVRVEKIPLVRSEEFTAAIRAGEIGFPFLLGVERIPVELVLDAAPRAKVVGVEFLEPGFLTADT